MHIARQRAGQWSNLANTSKDIDRSKWPYLLIELFLGQREPDAVEVAMRHSDPHIAAILRCEANFFLGQWHILRSETSEAMSLLTEAVEICPFGIVEAVAAQAELARLQ